MSERATSPTRTGPVENATGLLTTGVLLTVTIAVVLGLTDPRGWLSGFVAASLLVFLPVATIAQPSTDVDLRGQRVPVFVSTIVALALMGIVVYWLGASYGGPSALWLAPAPQPGPMLAWSALVFGLGLAVVYAFRAASPRLGWKETKTVRSLIPETPTERALFVPLSLAAGVSEELAFRGFLPWMLAPWLGSYLAAAGVGAVAFGLLHAYQDVHGIWRTGLMGLVFALGVAWSGSLWPAIVAHAALDIVLGLVLHRSLLDADA